MTGRLVSNTGPVIALALIDRIDILQKLFQLKLLVQSAHYSIGRYFTEALGIEGWDTGGVYCIHSQSSLFNVHPHTHALVPAGIIKDGFHVTHLF